MRGPYIVTAFAVLLVVFLFFFGRTTEPKKAVPATKETSLTFHIDSFIIKEKQKLSPAQTLFLSGLEESVKRGDVHTQQLQVYHSLSTFWKDSVHVFEPYAYYVSESAKLDNSEKSLTFAARLFLERIRMENDESKIEWESSLAIDLFERAIRLNPEDEDLKVGLGSVYVFGRGRSGNPEATMKGIQELLSVVRKNPDNMKAQLVLGIGGLASGQYEKAVDRFKKVLEKEPANVEAVAYLADTYAAMGNKEEAIRWYNVSKKMVNDPHYSQEVDERIKSIR